MKITGYLVVKVQINAPDGSNPTDVVNEVAAHCDYHVKYNQPNGPQIANTEILGMGTKPVEPEYRDPLPTNSD